jgi:hypothetical protein
MKTRQLLQVKKVMLNHFSLILLIVNFVIVIGLAFGQNETGNVKKCAKKVKLIVEQSYGKATISLPLKENAERWLLYADAEVVPEKSTDYNAIFRINVIGKPLGENYGPAGHLYRYTGASLKGTILFETVDGFQLKDDFNHDINPPSTIAFPPDFKDWEGKPNDAPFKNALDLSSFTRKMARLMENIYGINVILSAFRDANETYLLTHQIWAAEILEKMGSRAVDSLITIMKDKSINVRLNAIEALAKIKDKRAVNPLISVLQDENRNVKLYAIDALGKLKDNRAVEPLISVLKEDAEEYFRLRNNDVRVRAASALGELKDNRAVGPLISVLKDKSIYLRLFAIRTLGKLNDMRAVDPLISALKENKTPVVRTYSAEALKNITGKSYGLQSDKWQEWWRKNQGEYLKSK